MSSEQQAAGRQAGGVAPQSDPGDEITARATQPLIIPVKVPSWANSIISQGVITIRNQFPIACLVI